jgi:hypothetical protein
MAGYTMTDYTSRMPGYTIEIYDYETKNWHRSKAFWTPSYRKISVFLETLARNAREVLQLRKYRIVNTGTGKVYETWSNGGTA